MMPRLSPDRSPAPLAAMTQALQEVRASAATVHAGAFAVPPVEARLRRLVYGFMLPFGILRVGLADPLRRREYVRTLAPAMVATLLLGALFASWGASVKSTPEPTRAPGPPPPAVAAALDLLPGNLIVTSEPRPTGLSVTGPPARPSDSSRLLPWFWAMLTAALGALKVFEWIIVAFTRDHQDLLQRRMSLATGVPPEDPELRPRVRLDFRWLWKRARKKLRATLLIVWGLIPLAFLAFVPGVYTVVAFAWTAYWWSVFALARTRYSWDHGERQEPYYLRAAEAVGRVPLTGPLRAYTRFWRRRSDSVVPACTAFERAPWEAVGLGAARFLLYLPVVYLFFRPILSVAAQHIARGRLQAWQAPQTSALLDAEPAVAPAPVAASA